MAGVIRAVFPWLLLTGLSSGQTSSPVALSCVDGGRLEEQVLFVGQQRPPFHLNCSLEGLQVHNSSLTWQKDCEPLHGQDGKAYLEFPFLTVEDQGNYTCTPQTNRDAFTVRLVVKESPCSKPPDFEPKAGLTTVWAAWESTVHLNCTAVLPWDPDQDRCDGELHWSRDGQPFTNRSLHMQNSSSW